MNTETNPSPPPPPSAEAIQLAELRRAEVLTYTHTIDRPGPTLLAGVVVAVLVSLYALPERQKAAALPVFVFVSAGGALWQRRRAGATPDGAQMLRALGWWGFALVPIMAVGFALLWLLWPVFPWWAVAIAGFGVGVVGDLANRRLMHEAARRIEAEAFGPPGTRGRR